MNLKVYIYPTEENNLNESDRVLYYKSFLFKYTSDSTIGDLMRVCYQTYQEEFDPFGHNQRFVWKRGDRFVELNEQFNLEEFLAINNISESLELFYVIGLPGGYGLEVIEGVQFLFHSNEEGHTPHVHARYQGKDISVDLLNLNVTGSFKNRKKMEIAMQYVRERRDELITLYYEHTTGVYVDLNQLMVPD